MVGSDDANLPFEKKHILLWSALESMEVFQKLPQKPHFRPLGQLDETFREGRAIACMINFCNVVNRSLRIQFLSEPESRTDELEQNLFELEENGFNVELVKKQVALREKLKRIQEHIEEAKGEVNKVRIEEGMNALSKEQAMSMMEAKDYEITSLQLKVLTLKEDIADVKHDFQTSVASLGIAVGTNQVLSPEVTGQEDSPPIVENCGHNLVSDKYETKDTTDTCVKAKIQEEKNNNRCGSDNVAEVSEVEKVNWIRACVEIERAREETISSTNDVGDVPNVDKDEGEYVGVEDDDEEMEDDIAESDSNPDDQDLWNEMSVMLTENWEPHLVDSSPADQIGGNQGAEECDHQFIFKDDTGSVCRVCGLIGKGIDSIIEYQFGKRKANERACRYGRPSGNGSGSTSEMHVSDGIRLDDNFQEVSIHPLHRKSVKPHQLEGLNFLMSNLMAENPGGCVMAHAPGSGKTFMIIIFLQIFMSKYPSARPLIVLPRGILSTWRKEFQKWQVEDLPLFDFYSSKAESRSQQLEVLRKWGKERSILLLSYKQFTVIVSDIDDSKISKECRDFLLVHPSILIMDEGHTPRNEDTETSLSLEKVKTPRKVVLSGTLFQNHVKEVFNVLNLVRPNFLRTEQPKSIKARIMSKAKVSSRMVSLSDDHFYEAVERTILDDDIELKRKVQIIQDLREMTSKVLHYYKGDSLDELPGLVDFTIFLELSKRQSEAIEVLKQCKSKFRIFSEGSAIYVHPRLASVLKDSEGDGKVDVEKFDLLLKDMSEVGAKARFYLNLLELCEATGEKLLVFSQYLGPLKFLERLTVKVKNYCVGREMFVITGDSDSDIRDASMEQFNTSSSSRVFFGSIKACGEGISLVGASRIIILDVHLNPSVSRQAIGRAFRPGQQRKVYTYRLVASGSPEEEDHVTSYRKECIAKMWFEWNVYQGLKEFEMETVDVNNCVDLFLEMKKLNACIVSVCRRGSNNAEKGASGFVPLSGDHTAKQIEQLQVPSKDSLGKGALLEIKPGEKVQIGSPRKLIGGSVLSGSNGVFERSGKHGCSESGGQLPVKTHEEGQKRKMGRPRKRLELAGNTGAIEGSEKPGSSESDGQLLMKTGEEVHKRKRKRPEKLLDEYMLNSEVSRKRKKEIALESDAEKSLPRSHKITKKEKDVGEELIGSRIKVWWSLDQQYYEGIIESYDPSQKKHKVNYFDGDVENLILKKEKWLLVHGTSDSQPDQTFPSASAMPVAEPEEEKERIIEDEKKAAAKEGDASSSKERSEIASTKHQEHEKSG